MYREAFVSVCYICYRAREWNSPRTRVVDRNRAHTYKKGAAYDRARRQSAAAQPSSKGRPEVRPRFISTHLVFRPQTLPPHPPPPLTYGRPISGLMVLSVSALRHRAPRDRSGDRPRSTGRLSHLFSAAGTSRAGLPLRPPLHTSISRHSGWRLTTQTSTWPSSAAERSPAVAFALRRMRSSPLAKRRRPVP
jgi:hypothetical protein